MSDYPIIFSAPMIKALLAGRKTQTRRLAWRHCSACPDKKCHEGDLEGCDWRVPTPWQKIKVGDSLWVRECHSLLEGAFPESDEPGWEFTKLPLPANDVWYWADGNPQRGDWTKPRPSIHMPRWASRLTLTVTATKIERLLDISEEDAIAEGFAAGRLDDGFGPRDIGGGFTIESPGTFASASGMFQVTWAKLHPEWDGYSSPEVVALTFTVEFRNIDQARAA